MANHTDFRSMQSEICSHDPKRAWLVVGNGRSFLPFEVSCYFFGSWPLMTHGTDEWRRWLNHFRQLFRILNRTMPKKSLTVSGHARTVALSLAFVFEFRTGLIWRMPKKTTKGSNHRDIFVGNWNILGDNFIFSQDILVINILVRRIFWNIIVWLSYLGPFENLSRVISRTHLNRTWETSILLNSSYRIVWFCGFFCW